MTPAVESTAVVLRWSLQQGADLDLCLFHAEKRWIRVLAGYRKFEHKNYVSPCDYCYLGIYIKNELATVIAHRLIEEFYARA